MSVNFDVIVIFPICGRFGAIRKQDSGRIVCNAMFWPVPTFYLTKTENKWKISNTTPILLLWYYFCQKMLVFCKKTYRHQQSQWRPGTRFQVSSIILTSFRQGVVLHSPTLHLPPIRPQNKPLKSPPRLALNRKYAVSKRIDYLR